MAIIGRTYSKPVEGDTIDVIVGNDVVIECDIDNHEDNVVIWKHGNRVLFAGDIRVRHDDRIEVIEDDLLIKDVAANYAGVYKCEIEDDEGLFKKSVEYLRVLEPPVAHILQGRHLTVKAGMNLALTCAGSGTPLPEVRWLHRGRVLSRGIGEAGVLLEYITREDQGEIACEASNNLDYTHTDTLTLDVLFAPEVKIFQPEILFQPKCGLELKCLVHSSSPPSVHWFHNNLLLHPRDGVTMWSLDNLHVLQIHSCDQQILGHFTCKAENNLGEAEESVTVYKEFVESKMDEFVSLEELQNNVRRNVNHEALHLLSSDTRIKISSSILILVASHFL